MDIHLSDVFQTLDQNKFAQDQICCLKQFENGLKCFVFHFAENHGPVGFETNGDFCFMVTKMPGDPNFQTPFNRMCTHQTKVKRNGKIMDFDDTWVG